MTHPISQTVRRALEQHWPLIASASWAFYCEFGRRGVTVLDLSTDPVSVGFIDPDDLNPERDPEQLRAAVACSTPSRDVTLVIISADRSQTFIKHVMAPPHGLFPLIAHHRFPTIPVDLETDRTEAQ